MVPPLRYEDFKNYTRAVCCSKCGDCKKKSWHQERVSEYVMTKDQFTTTERILSCFCSDVPYRIT